MAKGSGTKVVGTKTMAPAVRKGGSGRSFGKSSMMKGCTKK
jgi:hypothetical protein